MFDTFSLLSTLLGGPFSQLYERGTASGFTVVQAIFFCIFRRTLGVNNSELTRAFSSATFSFIPQSRLYFEWVHIFRIIKGFQPPSQKVLVLQGLPATFFKKYWFNSYTEICLTSSYQSLWLGQFLDYFSVLEKSHTGIVILWLRGLVHFTLDASSLLQVVHWLDYIPSLIQRTWPVLCTTSTIFRQVFSCKIDRMTTGLHFLAFT